MDAHAQLLEIIAKVRRRWRLKLAMRGIAVTAAAGAAALVIAAWGLQWMRFTPQSILAFRILIGGFFCVLAYAFLVRPLMRRVSDEQVALYLEEHEPSIEAALVSAVEADGTGLAQQSPTLVRRLIENAIERSRAVEDGQRVERAPLRLYSRALAVVVAVAAAAFLFGPAYMRHALS